MSLEKSNTPHHSETERDGLDALLETASSPGENPWLATQVLNRVRSESARPQGAFLEKVRRVFGMPRVRFAAGFAAIAVATALLLPRAEVGVGETSAVLPSSITAADATEITDELIVEDLEIFIAELNSELWQNDHSL
jgi:hypothetical protein